MSINKKLLHTVNDLKSKCERVQDNIQDWVDLEDDTMLENSINDVIKACINLKYAYKERGK